MMNKDKFLQSLHKARLSHTKWVSQMRILASGTIADEIITQKSFFETKFALWFQNEASYLLFEEDCTPLKEIEKLMQHMDSEYTLLYNISYKNRAKTFFQKFKPFTSEEEASAEKYLTAIKIITEKIEALLEKTSETIKHMPEEKFAFVETLSEIKDSDKNDRPISRSKQSHGGARGAYQD